MTFDNTAVLFLDTMEKINSEVIRLASEASEERLLVEIDALRDQLADRPLADDSVRVSIVEQIEKHEAALDLKKNGFQ